MQDVSSVVSADKIHSLYRFIDECKRNEADKIVPNEVKVLRVAMYGFGDLEQRAAVLHVVRICFNTRWFYAADTAPGRWEALLHFSNKDGVIMSRLGELCEFFKVSVMVDDLGKGVDENIVAFVRRIDGGINKTGWLRSKLRCSLMRVMRRLDDRDGNMRVRQHTGMDWTTGNTIHFFNQWQNTMLDLHRLQSNYTMQRQVYTDALCVYHSQNTEMRELLSVSNDILMSCGNHIRSLSWAASNNITDRCEANPLVALDTLEQLQVHTNKITHFLNTTPTPPPLP